MNDSSRVTRRPRWAWPPTARAAAAIAASTVIAACGSNSSSSSSSDGHPTQAQIQDQLRQDLLRFASCMRSHGVSNFPDPTSPGADKEFLLGQIPGVNPQAPGFHSADTACKHLLPGGGSSAHGATAQVMAQLLHTSRCVRAHGLTGFPTRRLHPRPTRPPTSISPGSARTTRRRARPRCLPRDPELDRPELAGGRAGGDRVPLPAAVMPSPGSCRPPEVARADPHADAATSREIGERLAAARESQEQLLEALHTSPRASTRTSAAGAHRPRRDCRLSGLIAGKAPAEGDQLASSGWSVSTYFAADAAITIAAADLR